MGHWAQNESFTMAVSVLWPEPYRKWVRWTEEKYYNGAVNLKDLERFCMKKWSLISYQVFSKLFRHYRRKLRAVTLGKGHCNNWGANNCGQHEIVKAFISSWDFLPTFNCFTSMIRLEICEFFEWKIKRINNADLFHSCLCSYLPRVPILVETLYIELYYIGIKSQKTYICCSFHSPI